jgi:hypothetical protein
MDALSPQHTPVDAAGPSNQSATEHSASESHSAPEKENWKYEIRSGKVTKVSTHKSGPSTPSTAQSVPPTPSDSTTPQPAFTRPPVDRAPSEKAFPPESIKKFVDCGDMADHQMVESLARGEFIPALLPSSQMFFGSTRKRPLEDSSRAFRYGKVNPVNQPSVREEKFDPLSREDGTNLAKLRNENTPLLQLYDSRVLAAILAMPPNCFCQKPCARFDGNVPVYVCGSFKDLYHTPSYWISLTAQFCSSRLCAGMCFPYACFILGTPRRHL